MKRSQILLTESLDKQVKKIARKRGNSQSATIRDLLDQALNNSTQSHRDSQSDNSLLELKSYSSQNPRISGFRELYSVGAKTAELGIIPDKTYRHYLEHGAFPTGFESKLLQLSNTLREYSITKKLVLRRAYVVPGIENPPGPRFIGIEPGDILPALKELYEFAKKHNYDKKESLIEAFLYAFADPAPLEPPLLPGTDFPYGGYAIPLNQKATRVEVLGVWGNNEGVQSFDAVDRYLVDTDRMIITEKEIPQKPIMLATTKTEQAAKIEVPLNKQFEQVLSDSEILESARIVHELTGKYGLRRIEYSYNGRDTLEYNESIAYSITEGKESNLNIKGTVKRIKTAEDIDKASKSEKGILYIDKSIVENRSYDLLNQLAGLKSKYTILYPGLSATAHAMRVLTDFGHTAIVVGNRRFTEGEEIHIETQDDGELNISRTKGSASAQMIVNLYDARLYGVEKVGGKAFNLSLLKTYGFNVPHGYALTTKFFRAVIESSFGKKNAADIIAGNWGILKKKENRDKISIPDKLWRSLLKDIGVSPEKQYAVRSSATVEDQTEHSFAGQFESYLKVDYVDLKQHVEKVMKSTFSLQVINYFEALNMPSTTEMAVVIQEMVDADKAGVVFGKNVTTRNIHQVIIDVTPGLAEGVVDGTKETQRIHYSKIKDIFTFSKESKMRLLSDIELKALVEMNNRLESRLGRVQDIEWAIDKKGSIWIVQSRDL